MAVMAVMAAALVTTTKTRMEVNEAEAIVATLEAYHTAIVNFRAHVGAWPGTARQLAFEPDAPVIPHVNDDNICENSFTAAQLAAWRGPYLAQLVDTSGVQVGNATIRRRFLREPGTTSIAGDLIIFVANVEENVATIVDGSMDGRPADFSLGAVRYTPGTELLTYRMRIGGC